MLLPAGRGGRCAARGRERGLREGFPREARDAWQPTYPPALPRLVFCLLVVACASGRRALRAPLLPPPLRAMYENVVGGALKLKKRAPASKGAPSGASRPQHSAEQLFASAGPTGGRLGKLGASGGVSKPSGDAGGSLRSWTAQRVDRGQQGFSARRRAPVLPGRARWADPDDLDAVGKKKDSAARGKTAAEKDQARHSAARREAEWEKDTGDTYRDRINKYNEDLSKLSEHHDIPKGTYGTFSSTSHTSHSGQWRDSECLDGCCAKLRRGPRGTVSLFLVADTVFTICVVGPG